MGNETKAALAESVLHQQLAIGGQRAFTEEESSQAAATPELIVTELRGQRTKAMRFGKE